MNSCFQAGVSDLNVLKNENSPYHVETIPATGMFGNSRLRPDGDYDLQDHGSNRKTLFSKRRYHGPILTSNEY
jgi:hypothetical protein